MHFRIYSSVVLSACAFVESFLPTNCKLEGFSKTLGAEILRQPPNPNDQYCFSLLFLNGVYFCDQGMGVLDRFL